MAKLPTYNDFKEAKPAELKRVYKLSDRQLEMAQRRVLDGASQNDIRKEYEPFYRRNRRDA